MPLWLAIALVAIIAVTTSAATAAVVAYRDGRIWHRYALVAVVGLFGLAVFFISGITGRFS